MGLALLNPCIHELYQTFNEGLNFQTVWFDSRWLAILATTSGSLELTVSSTAFFRSDSDHSYTREGIRSKLIEKKSLGTRQDSCKNLNERCSSAYHCFKMINYIAHI